MAIVQALVVALARAVVDSADVGTTHQLWMGGQKTKPRMTLTVDLETWERLRAALEEFGAA